MGFVLTSEGSDKIEVGVESATIEVTFKSPSVIRFGTGNSIKTAREQEITSGGAGAV